MTTLAALVLLVLLVIGWTVAAEYVILIVFNIPDSWRGYVKRK